MRFLYARTLVLRRTRLQQPFCLVQRMVRQSSGVFQNGQRYRTVVARAAGRLRIGRLQV